MAVQSASSVDLKVSFFRDGVHLASLHDSEHAAPMREGEFVSRLAIPADVFRPGRYTIGIGATSGLGSWVWGTDVAVLDVLENRGARSAERTEGVLAIPYRGERIQ